MAFQFLYYGVAVCSSVMFALLVAAVGNCIDSKKLQHRRSVTGCLETIGNAFAQYVTEAHQGRVVRISEAELTKSGLLSEADGQDCFTVIRREGIDITVPDEIIGRNLEDLPPEQALLIIRGDSYWSAFTVLRALAARHRSR